MWSLFAFLSVAGAASMPLLHQAIRSDTLSMLFWLRVFSFFCMVPIVLYIGLPTHPFFYIGTILIALWMAITDMIYFNGVKKHGAGVISRVLPMAAIPTFFLWFLYNPALIQNYLDHPVRSLMILGCLFFGVFCATRMRHDHISLAAVRDIWFVILGATLGPIASKIVLSYAPLNVSGLAFVMTQGGILAIAYYLYWLIKKPVAGDIFLSRLSIGAGALIALGSMLSIGAKAYAFILVDNPAYVSVVLFTAPVFIAAIEKWMGKKDESDKIAGFGLVLAAALLVTLQFK